MEIALRPAVAADIPRLRVLIDASVRGLQRHDYTGEQIECALATIYGVDSTLIADQTYFIAESVAGQIAAGCGGWSKRATLYGADKWPHRSEALLDPAVDAAKIRAFFVHPDWARRGVASRILAACESAARAAGFKRFELGATLTGVALYHARGYAPTTYANIALGGDAVLPIVRMEKSDLSAVQRAPAAWVSNEMT